MQYQTVFDVINVGYRYWYIPAAMLGLTVASIMFLLLIKLVGGKARGILAFSIYSTLILSPFLSLAMFFSTYSDYRELRNAPQEGKTVVIEGNVENFILMPYEGHHPSSESFTVAGHTFAYSEYEDTAGFNTTSSHGGPIRPGIYVRIYALGNKIARLEVAR